MQSTILRHPHTKMKSARTHAGKDIMAPFFSPSSAGQAPPRLSINVAYVMGFLHSGSRALKTGVMDLGGAEYVISPWSTSRKNGLDVED